MTRIAATPSETSCLISNLFTELRPVCGFCEGDSVVLCGMTYAGTEEAVVLRDYGFDFTGDAAVVENIRNRRCIIINTGDYRRNFNSSSKAIRIGTAYKIDVFNNLDYAKPLEYGFRGHFVPGHWDGKSFVYQPKDPQGGMFVHSLIPGHYTLERAVNATKRTQNARLQRRFEQELKKRGYMKYFK